MEECEAPPWLERGPDAGQRGQHGGRVDRQRRGTGGELSPGVPERRAGHHRKGHDPDGSDRPGVDAGARLHPVGNQRGGSEQKEAERDESIADVEDQREAVPNGSVAGPPGHPYRLQEPARRERDARRPKARGDHPGGQSAAGYRQGDPIEAPEGAGRRPGFSRTSQLRVKLGTMRPPTSMMRATAAAMPSRCP